MKVGILALQGSFKEHQDILNKLNVDNILVKTVEDLNKVDGIILPGGESTAIGRLLKIFNLLEPLKDKIQNGLPVYGTCAGMILLAKYIVGEDSHLGVMNIMVRRNAYGRQLSSFSCTKYIQLFNKEVPLVFIRAPWIEEVYENVTVLLKVNDKIVCAQQNNMLVSSFHPELTSEDRKSVV